MTIHDLDRMFSRLVRSRADWACVRCGKRFRWGDSALHCSHFHSRRLKSVRFDLENGESMCAASALSKNDPGPLSKNDPIAWYPDLALSS